MRKDYIMDDLNISAETQEVAEPVINEQATETTEQTVNADSTEVTTAQVDEKQVQTSEENAKFATIRREYEAKIATESQRAIDAEYSRLYGESHNIHTKADYDQAIKAQEEQNRIDEYMQNNIPEEYARELVESKKFREQFESEKQQQQARAQQERNYAEFLTEYPTVKADEIPNEVWVEVGNGKSLVDAYAKHEVTILKAKIAEYEKGSKTQEINNKNALTSTGSTVGNGVTPNDFIAKEVFEANKGNHDWLNKNYDLLTNSMNKWK